MRGAVIHAPATSASRRWTTRRSCTRAMRSARDAGHSSRAALAERLYALHTERNGFRHYAEPMPE